MNTITASSKIEKSCTPESFEKGEFASKMLEIAEKEMNVDEILAELSNCIPHVEISNNIGNVNRIQSAKVKNAEINNLDDILIEPSAKCISNAGLFERNSEHYISCTSVSEVDKFQADVPNGNKMECYGSISNTDDIGSNLVAVDSNYNHDSFEKELDSLHKTCANSFQIVNPFGENIRKELDVIEKKIHVLMNESHASLMSYPVPYEVLQNVLQAMYSVWRKSECSISKEVLHKYIEQIIHWSYSFSDGKMKFSCEICSSK
ncbi:hypothetical protein NPIL_664221 [Nephila pilipes]|uniref:Uncharacterized protein n=1 Tax=Nephila pilipes TaxID=299642 RepID=A0A8X6TK13_NEPPI|nr:hypothetical protein NPIL_664221 [Nephila pilipes]